MAWIRTTRPERPLINQDYEVITEGYAFKGRRKDIEALYDKIQRECILLGIDFEEVEIPCHA